MAAAGADGADLRLSADLKRQLSLLLLVGPTAHQTEFKSPAPPHELNFAHGAALELSAFGSVLRSLGLVAASTITKVRRSEAEW